MTTRKKLFFIINRLVLGGHSADVISLASDLSDKYDVTILYGEKETEEIEVSSFFESHSRIAFLKIHSLHRSILPLQDALAFRQLLIILRKHRPDIVHTHGFKSGFLGRLAAKRVGVPVIIHTYHGHHFHSYYNRFVSSVICRIERWLASFSTRIIAISPQQAHEISGVYRIAPINKISIIFLGISKENYHSLQPQTSLKETYQIDKETVVIAIIGRLVAIKNHSFFLRIVERMLQQKKNVCFFIIGDGNQKSGIKKAFKQHNIQWQEGNKKKRDANVYFTSWITDIASALPDIDIVVLTSLNEGTPVSLIEAQLFGKPVIATNVGGVQDTILDGQTGFLIDDFNLDEFAKKSELLIDDPQLRNEMGLKGKQFVTDRFSKQKEVAAIDKLYTDCLQNVKY